MKIYKGYQFRGAVEELIHKIAKHYDTRVSVTWTSGISTAGINKRGEIMICNVRDDAVMNHRDLLRWVGYGVHELLHRLYTDFDARGDNRYEDAIHNAIEDAWIEHTGIRNILRCTPSLQWNSFTPGLHSFLIELTGHFSFDETWCYRIGANAA